MRTPSFFAIGFFLLGHLTSSALATTLIRQDDLEPHRGPVLENVESVPFVPESEAPVPPPRPTPTPPSLEVSLKSKDWRTTTFPVRSDEYALMERLNEIMQPLAPTPNDIPGGSDYPNSQREYKRIILHGAYEHITSPSRDEGSRFALNVTATSCVQQQPDTWKECVVQDCLVDLKVQEADYIYYDTDIVRPADDDVTMVAHQCRLTPPAKCLQCYGEDDCAAELQFPDVCNLPQKFDLEKYPACYQKTATVAGSGFVYERGCGNFPLHLQHVLGKYDFSRGSGMSECWPEDRAHYSRICRCLGDECNGKNHLRNRSSSRLSDEEIAVQQLRLDIKRMLHEMIDA